MILSDNYCYYVRKNAPLSSTVGADKNIVNMINTEGRPVSHALGENASRNFSPQFTGPLSDRLEDALKEFTDGKQQHNRTEFADFQRTQRTMVDEYGLLNRLDSATSGWLYFAKSPAVYQQWKIAQNSDLIEKVYYAYVDGSIADIFTYGSKDETVLLFDNTITVKRSIMHHKHDNKKMLVIAHPATAKKGRGELLEATTSITPLKYDEKADNTLVKVSLYRGKRHQIRAHCASLGNPIQGDSIYGAQQGSIFTADRIALRSMGVAFDGVIFG